MSDESIHIRSARPSLEEGRTYARLVNEILEGGFRTLLGKDYVEVLAHAFAEPGHGMAHVYTLFAERGESIVGLVSGYVEGETHESEDEALMIAPGNRFRRRIGALLMRLRWRLIGFPPPGEFYVEFLVVDAAFRGHGIGGMLLDTMEAKARDAGVRRLTLDVATKNHRGQRFYERRGMSRVPNWPRTWLGRRFVLRMTKALE